MNTLTEKVNGRREWSAYGLTEIQKSEHEMMTLIVITNALSECGLKSTKHDSRMFWISQHLFVRATRQGTLIGKDACGSDGDEVILETVKDPRTLFERIRVIWGNRYP
jgi:hypothetical protein